MRACCHASHAFNATWGTAMNVVDTDPESGLILRKPIDRGIGRSPVPQRWLWRRRLRFARFTGIRYEVQWIRGRRVREPPEKAAAVARPTRSSVGRVRVVMGDGRLGRFAVPLAGFTASSGMPRSCS